VTKPNSGTSSSRSAKSGSSARPKAGAKSARRAVPKPPETPGHARIIAIANQKGGVGKSTTAVSLGAALADLGYRILVVDLDPQGNASTGMGIRHEARDVTVYDVIVSEASLDDAIVQTPVERLHAIPSTIDLAGAEIELVSQFSREGRLKKALQPVADGVYDFVLMDCPPSLGLLTVNALTAAEELIVPIQCEYYALEGLGQLLRNVSLVQQNINPGLRLAGIVMTMFDPRTRLSEQVVDEVQKFFGDLVYDVIIPRTVRLSEAPGFGQPITVYDPKSKGAECYRQLAREVALRPPPDQPMPVFNDLPTLVVPAIDDVVTRGPLEESEIEELPTVHEVVEEYEAEEALARAEASAGPAAPAHEPEPKPEPEPEAGSDAAALLGELSADAEEEAPPRTTEEVLAEAAHEVEAAQEVEDLELWDEPEAPERVKPPSSPPPAGHLPERRVVVIGEDADLAKSEPREPESPSTPEHPAMANIGATLEENARKRRWRLFRKGGE